MLSLINIILAVLLIWLACKYFDLKQSLSPNEKRYASLINAVSSITDRVEGYNTYHSKEVASLAVKIAKNSKLSYDQIKSLEIAAKLHDIGMLLVVDDVIKSRHKLKGEESFFMKNHPLLAEHFIKQEVSIIDEVPTIIRWHHERWDGFGYPDSLRGEQIPIASRILAIADSVSAMKNQRNYRKRNYKSTQEIIAELKLQSGLQFDPNIVKKTVAILEEDIQNQKEQQD